MQNLSFDPLRFARPLPLSDEARRTLIAEAAYFRSQNRGLNPADPVDDWLAAEVEVDSRLARQAAVAR